MLPAANTARTGFLPNDRGEFIVWCDGRDYISSHKWRHMRTANPNIVPRLPSYRPKGRHFFPPIYGTPSPPNHPAFRFHWHAPTTISFLGRGRRTRSASQHHRSEQQPAAAAADDKSLDRGRETDDGDDVATETRRVVKSSR